MAVYPIFFFFFLQYGSLFYKKKQQPPCYEASCSLSTTVEAAQRVS